MGAWHNHCPKIVTKKILYNEKSEIINLIGRWGTFYEKPFQSFPRARVAQWVR